MASGDYIDLKMYEPAMRHLLDTYISAEKSETLSVFENMTLVDMLVQSGVSAIDALPDGILDSPTATSETIENNMRRVVMDKYALNPVYYEKMSSLLDALVQRRKIAAIEYEDYLSQIAVLAKRVKEGDGDYPPAIDGAGLRALYDNLPDDGALTLVREESGSYSAGDGVEWRESKALALDKAIRSSAPDKWRGNTMKERTVESAIRAKLGDRPELVNAIFEIVKAQSEY